MTSIQRPTIILFAAFYDPWASGAERFVQEIAERLAPRYCFVLYTSRLSRSVPARELRVGYEIRRVGFGTRLDKWFFPILAPLAALRIRASIAHAVMESYAGIALLAYGWLRPKTRRILTLQSGDLDSEKKQRRIPSWLWRRIHTHPHLITSISHFLAKRARGLGVPDGRIAVISNGVDLSRFSMRPRTQAVPGRIITIARLSWEKGLADLLHALAVVRRTHPQTHLVLIGGGSLKEELERLAVSLNIRDAVDFRGSMPNADAMELAKTGEIFVCPSLAEGLGIVFLEAQALGLPVIGTRVGGIPDVIEHEHTGLLVEPHDPEGLAGAVSRLLKDAAFADALAARAHARLAQFDWPVIVERIADCYQALIRSRTFLIATGIYPPETGGPATYAALLARKLTEERHEISVVTYGSRITQDSKERWNVFVVQRSASRMARYAAYAWRVFWHGKDADAILALDTVSAGYPATVANRFLRKPFFLRVVGDYAWEQGCVRFGVKESLEDFQQCAYGAPVERMRRIQRNVVACATAVITPSRYLARIVSGWTNGLGAVRVVPNAVDVTCASAPIVPISGEKLLLSIGRLVPWKGMAELVEAFSDVVRQQPDARLAIIGEGPDRDRIETAIRAHGLDGKIALVGRVPHDQLRSWYVRAHGFVLNTAYEGFSHQLAEVMAAGLPLATTSAGGNAEMLRDGENGRVFTINHRAHMAAAMLEMLRDPERCRERAARALQDARAWNEDRLARETLSVLQMASVPPRVLMVTLDATAGDERSDTAERFARYAEETVRLDVVVMGTGAFGVKQLSSRCRVVKSGGWTKVDAFFRAAVLAAWFASRVRYDVVDAQDPFFTSVAAWWPAFVCRAKRVVELHGDFWTLTAEERISGARAWMAEHAVLRADRVRAVSRRVAEHLLAAIPKAADVETIVFPVMHRNSQQTGLDVPRRTDRAARTGVIILFVGRLSREKGLDFFLPVFADAAKTHSAVTLLVAGDGPDRVFLEQEAERLGVRDRVIFLGFVHDVETLYAQADFVVIPSRQESWSRVAAEAVAVGVPVLMTDVGCAGEIVIHEQNGLIVPVLDRGEMFRALVRMVEDPKLRGQLAQGTRESAGRLPSMDENVRSYVSLWDPHL